MEELKPCPFCDGEATVSTGYFKYKFFVQCLECECKLGYEIQPFQYDQVESGCFGTVQEAITAWNTREDKLNDIYKS